MKYIGSSILSVPSWVIPGTYAENLNFLETVKEIDGVELLFFQYNDETKAQLDSEWEEIRRYRGRFVFTAHLPDSLHPAHGELIARLYPLARHFIVHPSQQDPAALARLLSEWTEHFGMSFLAENTQPGLLEALLPHLGAGAGICMDSGHLLLEEQNPAEFFTHYRERIKEIHLHSADLQQAALDKKLADHRQLRGNEKWLLELLPLLKDFEGVINLEVFSWEEARNSISIFTEH